MPSLTAQHEKVDDDGISASISTTAHDDDSNQRQQEEEDTKEKDMMEDLNNQKEENEGLESLKQGCVNDTANAKPPASSDAPSLPSLQENTPHEGKATTNTNTTIPLPEDVEMMNFEESTSFSFDEQHHTKKEPLSLKSSSSEGDDDDLPQDIPHTQTSIPQQPTSTTQSPSNTSSSKNNLAPTITSADVLCGRGGGTNHHEGNIRFRSIVTTHRSSYLCAKKKEKTQIAKQIVHLIHQSGGRFLEKQQQQQQMECWMEVTQDKSIKKTLQALREGLDVRKKLSGLTLLKGIAKQEITSADVLCGGHADIKLHFGNKRLQVLVEARKETYSVAKKGHKSVIAQKIVEIVKAQGGRFLENTTSVMKKKEDLEEECGGGWKEVDIYKAQRRVLKMIRDAVIASETKKKEEEDKVLLHDGSNENQSEEEEEEEEEASMSPTKKQKTDLNSKKTSTTTTTTTISIEEAERGQIMRWCDCPICDQMREKEAWKKKKMTVQKKKSSTSSSDSSLSPKKRGRGRPRGSTKQSTAASSKAIKGAANNAKGKAVASQKGSGTVLAVTSPKGGVII